MLQAIRNPWPKQHTLLVVQRNGARQNRCRIRKYFILIEKKNNVTMKKQKHRVQELGVAQHRVFHGEIFMIYHASDLQPNGEH